MPILPPFYAHPDYPQHQEMLPPSVTGSDIVRASEEATSKGGVVDYFGAESNVEVFFEVPFATIKRVIAARETDLSYNQWLDEHDLGRNVESGNCSGELWWILYEDTAGKYRFKMAWRLDCCYPGNEPVIEMQDDLVADDMAALWTAMDYDARFNVYRHLYSVEEDVAEHY